MTVFRETLQINLWFWIAFIGTGAFGFLFTPYLYAQTSVIESISSSTIPVSVKDSILMALENNNSLQVEKYNPSIAQTFVEQELSVFDPLLTAEITASEDKGKRTSGVGEFRDVNNRSKNFTADVTKRLQNGIELGVNSRVNTRESNVFTRLYSTRIGATLNVPILEGRGSAVNLVGVKQAEKDIEISQHELHGFVLALMNQIEMLYWDLYAAQQELLILQESRHLAQEQLRETQERIAVGSLPEIELAAAEGELALREEALITANSDLEIIRLQFLARIHPPMENYWSMEIQLLENPVEETGIAGTLEDHIQMALTVRPEIREALARLERNELQIIRTKNGLLPRLDFFVLYGKTGYANTFGDSLSAFEDDTFDINLGFQFQHSFGRRAQHAAHQLAELNLEQAHSAIQNLEQLIELDVRSSYINIGRYQKLIEATKIATRFQEANYRAELEKFRVGKSTNLLVLVTQRDLTQSRLDELRAEINLRKAIAGFHYAEGTLTDYHKVVLPELIDTEIDNSNQ